MLFFNYFKGSIWFDFIDLSIQCRILHGTSLSSVLTQIHPWMEMHFQCHCGPIRLYNLTTNASLMVWNSGKGPQGQCQHNHTKQTVIHSHIHPPPLCFRQPPTINFLEVNVPSKSQEYRPTNELETESRISRRVFRQLELLNGSGHLVQRRRLDS